MRSRDFKPAAKWRRKRFASRSAAARILSRARVVRSFQRRFERCRCRKPWGQRGPSPLLRRGRGGAGYPTLLQRQAEGCSCYLHGGKGLGRAHSRGGWGGGWVPCAAAPPWGGYWGDPSTAPPPSRDAPVCREPPPGERQPPDPRGTQGAPPTSAPWDRALQACQDPLKACHGPSTAPPSLQGTPTSAP